MTIHNTLETIGPDQLVDVAGGFGAQLTAGMARARAMGLTITATTNGRHVKHSLHYQGRAFDAAGKPSTMARFYDEMAQTNPTQLFYDPKGAYLNGQPHRAIGGHGDHVHLAY